MNIGFLIDTDRLHGHASKIYSYLQSIPEFKVEVIVNRFPSEQHFGLKRKLKEYGIKRFIEKTLFSLICKLEDRQKSQTAVSIRADIDIFPLPSKRNIHYRYSDVDIAKLSDRSFDLIVRGDGRGIYKGKILNVARDGILSLHHSDNRKILGGPPVFWEVFEQHRNSGFIVQILTESLDDGFVVDRGQVPTRNSYSENKAAILVAAQNCLERVLEEYLVTGMISGQKTSQPGRFYTTPELIDIIQYLSIRITAKFRK